MDEPGAQVEVTVILRTFDRAHVLPRAIGSVLDQTLEDFELLAVDDASADSTASVLADFSSRDPRVRVLRRPVNSRRTLPPAEPMNDGLAHARGRFVAHLDDDNMWHPRFLELLAQCLRENPQVALAYCDTRDHWSPTVCAAKAGDPRHCADRTTTSTVFPHQGRFEGLEIGIGGIGYLDYIDTNEFMCRLRDALAIGGWRRHHPQVEAISAAQGRRGCDRRHNDVDFVERLLEARGADSQRYIEEVLVDYIDRSHLLHDDPRALVTNGELVVGPAFRMADAPAAQRTTSVLQTVPYEG